jgi:hypothetical protein
MAWEWRYFVKTCLPEDGTLPLEGKREDIYFPASESAGFKLRNGSGGVEVKLRTRTSDADGCLPAPAEFWQKSIHSGCVAKLERGEKHVVLDAAACAKAVGSSQKDVFSGGCSLPINVLCRKKRRHTRLGEDVDCLFIAVLQGHTKPLLVERFQSICVESTDLKYVVKAVRDLGSLPSDAIVGGYPKIVQEIVQRSMQVASELSSSASLSSIAEVETHESNNEHIVRYKVLQDGDVRSAPSRDAPCVGRLQEGHVLQATRKHVSNENVHWVYLCESNSSEGVLEGVVGWASTTKKNGTLKLVAISEAKVQA